MVYFLFILAKAIACALKEVAKLLKFISLFGSEYFPFKPLFRFEKKGNSPDEHIYSAMSRTNVGRYVSIFFIYKRNRDALIISARDMTKKERQYYAKRKK